MFPVIKVLGGGTWSEIQRRGDKKIVTTANTAVREDKMKRGNLFKALPLSSSPFDLDSNRREIHVVHLSLFSINIITKLSI